MAADKPLVYLILGAAGSGRREVLLDLIAGGLPDDARPQVLLSADEAATEADAKLPRSARWTWAGEAIEATVAPDATHVFLMADGRGNPVDLVEAAKPWIDLVGGEIGRILCVINCQLAEAQPPLLAWFDACVHFSDVVLLNHREGVANKWMSEFQRRYTGQFYPCLFEFVKQGRVHNPAEVLEPEARRMAHLFDEEPEWAAVELDEDDEESEGDEENEAGSEEDPYLARRLGGRRVREIPEVGKYLGE